MKLYLVSAGVQVDVVPALMGDACLGNAFALQQSRLLAAIPSSSSPTKGQGRGQAVPVYLHERGFAMISEDHYLVAGLSANPYAVHTQVHMTLTLLLILLPTCLQLQKVFVQQWPLYMSCWH